MDSGSKPLNHLYTGHQDYKKTRKYSRYYDNAFISVWEEFYNGNEVVYHYRNPYAKFIQVDGTDGYQFSPDLSTEDNIELFDEFAMRPVSFIYQKQFTHGDLETLKYTIDNDNYASKSKYFDPYTCPIKNVSSIYETPIYVGLPKYKLCININIKKYRFKNRIARQSFN